VPFAVEFGIEVEVIGAAPMPRSRSRWPACTAQRRCGRRAASPSNSPGSPTTAAEAEREAERRAATADQMRAAADEAAEKMSEHLAVEHAGAA